MDFTGLLFCLFYYILRLQQAKSVLFLTIIYSTGKPRNGCIYSEPVEGGMMPMVTYSDLFTFVIMICAVVTLVHDFRHKK